MKKLFSLLIAAVLPLLCLMPAAAPLLLTTGCGTLAPAGAYAGDKVLYNTDVTIATSYDALHVFVKWEYENREALSGTPEIKSYADTIRKNAPRYFASALALRDAYAANPSSGTKSALQASLNVIRQATAEATRYLVSNRSFTPPQ